MKIDILAFGIAKEIFGKPGVAIELKDSATTTELKAALEEQYPKLKELKSYMIAVNNEYAQPGTVISQEDEIAIIPPVSGG